MPKPSKRDRTKAQRSTAPRKAKTPAANESPASDAGAVGENLSRFNLFGQFDPMPISGRQRHLFDDSQVATTEASWPEASTVHGSKTFPRPWAKDDPRDRIIARRFKPEDTATMF